MSCSIQKGVFLSRGYKGYIYLYYTHIKTGKRKKITTKTKDREEAERCKEIFLRDKKDLYVNVNLILLSKLREDISEYHIKHKSANTKSSYNLVFDRLLNLLGDIPIKNITTIDIEKYKNQIVSQQYSNATFNNHLRVIKSIFNNAVKKFKYLLESPAQGVEKLEEPEKQRSFTKNEVNLLAENIDDKLIRNIFFFAVYTGARLGEILNIQWKDIDFKERTINVLNNRIFKTKNRKIRLIPISDELLSLLKDMKSELFDDDSDNIIVFPHYLFCKDRGINGLNRDYISKKFKNYLRSLGLEDNLNFHSTRYTAATFMAMEGRNIHEIQKILGHTDIRVTQRYIKVPTETMREAVNSITIPFIKNSFNKLQMN
jgi:integrase